MSRKPNIKEVNWAFSPNPLSNGSMERMHIGISLRFRSWVRSNLDQVAAAGDILTLDAACRSSSYTGRTRAPCPHQIESYVGGTAPGLGKGTGTFTALARVLMGGNHFHQVSRHEPIQALHTKFQGQGHFSQRPASAVGISPLS